MEGTFLFTLIFILGLSTRLDVFVGAQATGNITVASCEGDILFLMCPPGYNITVLKAVYGYTLYKDNNCAEGSPPYCNMNLPTGIQLTCDNRESCSLFTESRSVPQGSGCPSNRTNNLMITYTCSGMAITTETNMEEKHGNITVSSCKGDVMVLMCPSGFNITVLEALYGYTLSTGNNCSEESIPECSRNLPFTIQLVCDNRENCSFLTESRLTSRFSDCPYIWTNNLVVTYICSGMTITTPVTTTTETKLQEKHGHITVSSCVGDDMVLMCPSGSNITVFEALYGYTLSTDNNCSERSIPGCTRNLPTIIKWFCDNRESCSFITESRYVPQGSGCPSNWTNNLMITYTCSGMTTTTTITTVSSSSPATITVTPTYHHTSPVSTTLVTATSTQKTTAVETAEQGNPAAALPFTSSIIITSTRGTTISDTLGSTVTTRTTMNNLRIDGIQCAVIGGTLGAISLGLLILNIAAVCYIFRKKRSEKALPQSSNHSDQTHKNQDDREGGENTNAQLGEQEPQQQYTELELQRRSTQFHEENETQYVNQALPKSSNHSDQTHSRQANRNGGENTYAILGEQEPQQQYTELELQRSSGL